MNSLTERLEENLSTLVEIVKHIPQVPMPTKSFLLEGMYLRQCCIPAGTAFVGRKHKKPHYFICAKGEAQITTDNGIELIRAGMVLMVAPGSHRAGVTVEDTVFITIHRTEETDLAAIEDDLVTFDSRARYGVNNEILPLLEKPP